MAPGGWQSSSLCDERSVDQRGVCRGWVLKRAQKHGGSMCSQWRRPARSLAAGLVRWACHILLVASSCAGEVAGLADAAGVGWGAVAQAAEVPVPVHVGGAPVLGGAGPALGPSSRTGCWCWPVVMQGTGSTGTLTSCFCLEGGRRQMGEMAGVMSCTQQQRPGANPGKGNPSLTSQAAAARAYRRRSGMPLPGCQSSWARRRPR